jgi:RNA polymerase sigma factor (sigma-70 family)
VSADPADQPAQPAWEDFSESAREKIIKYVAAMTRDYALAEDVAQETLIIAWSKWEQVRQHPRPVAWALLVARRMTAKLCAQEQRQGRIAAKIAADRDHTGTSGGLGPQRQGGLEQALCDRDAVLAALARLPHRQREVIILCYLGDMTQADVAAVLGISVGTVKAHAHHGRAKLRKLLGRPPG